MKWAQTADGRIAAAGRERLLISNEASNRIVHRWRTEEMAIMVGTNTALLDDPQLLSRWWPGKQPVRLVLDLNLRLPGSLKILSDGHPTIVFCDRPHYASMENAGKVKEGLVHHPLDNALQLIPQIMEALCQLKIQSILVEGGARLLQTFIDAGTWDEARTITANKKFLGEGLPAPELKDARLVHTENCFDDTIRYYGRNTGNE